MGILLTLAWRNLWRRKLRTVLTIVSIMLGVGVIMAVRTANASTFNSIEALFDEAAGRANLTVESAVSSRQTTVGFSQSILQQVQSIPGVMLAAPRVNAQTVYQGRRNPIHLLVQGIEPAAEVQVHSYSVVEGAFLSSVSRGYTALVVDDFAARENIRVGQEIELLTPNGPEVFRIVGILARKGAGVTNGGQVVFVPLRVAQDAFGRGRRIDAVDVVAEPGLAQSVESLNRLREQLQATLGESYTVAYPASEGLTVTEALSGIQYGLGLFGLFALFASALLIHNTYTMEIAERIREIGTLRALGMSRAQIIGELLGSALVLSVIGSVLGLGLGLLLAMPLLQMFASVMGYALASLSPSREDAALSFSIGIAVTLIAALAPVLQACRLSPLEAVRVRGQASPSAGTRWSWIVGLALLAIWVASFFLPWIPSTPMFLFLFGGATLLLPSIVHQFSRRTRALTAALYGYEGSLGSTNLERARWRASATVAVLMVGIAMGISVGAISDSLTNGVQTWIDRALRADLFVSSYGTMSPAWGSRLAAIKGIAVVSPTRVLQVYAEDTQKPGRYFDVRVQAIDPATQSQMGALLYVSGQGEPSELWSRFVRGGSVLISTQIAEMRGIHQGDVLRLRTARGAQEFPVTATIVDYASMSGVAMMTWDDVQQFFGLDDVDTFYLKLTTDADADAVRQQIETLYGRSGLTVRSSTEAKQSAQQSIGTIMLAFNAIVLIAFVIAAFSIVNTLTMNVMERTREIGLLRAVGMTRLQIGKMILAETLVMGLAAVLFGVAFGGVFSRVSVWFMDTRLGFSVDYVLPVSALLVSCVLALAVTQIAALFPARRASASTLMEAMRYE
ncbi:MAG: ABC transporter permease [Chloroflexota bacterium]|nr:ABC transporter permease [Chloroflexota bacterium]